MENATLTGVPIMTGRHGIGVRASAVIAAFALVLTMFVLMQQQADATPAAGAAVAAASVATVGAAGAAQINFNQIICSLLISVRNSFANSPFFSFVQAAINPLIIAFGCGPS